MADKVWRTCRLTINGVAHKVQFNQETIEHLFYPFLRRLTRRRDKMGRRILVYLVAPPGAGKSTLALLLSKLSLTSDEFEPVQALGLEGFQYAAEYLRTHTARVEGRNVPMSELKGSPETFDVEKLRSKLSQLKEYDIRWPVYDRRTHDVVEDVVTLRKEIILLEGNWLLLRDGAWQDIRSFCDYSLFIAAKPEQLWERLVQRKIQGGMSPEAAARFYEKHERGHIERVMKHSWLANETWKLLSDGDYVLQMNAPKPISMVDRQTLWKKAKVVADDDDFLSNLHYKLSRINAGGSAAYSAGYSEGLVAARNDILRKIYQSGSMNKQKICETFHLKEEELDHILNDRPFRRE